MYKATASHMSISSGLFCGLAAAVALLGWVGAGCGGGWGGGGRGGYPTTYSAMETCRSWALEPQFEKAAGLGPPPSLPSAAGAPLREGVRRAGFEVSGFSLSPVADDGGATVPSNWVSTAMLGAHWYGGLLDAFEMGGYFRQTFGLNVESVRANDASVNPFSPSAFMAGLSLKGNWRIHGTPLSFSALGELGFRTRKGWYTREGTLRTTCDITCEAESGPRTDSFTRENTTDYTQTTIDSKVVHESVLDASVAIQGAFEVIDGFSMVLVGAVQERAVNVSREGDSKAMFSKFNQGVLRWRSIPVVNLGLGADISAGMGYGKIFVNYPLEFDEYVNYGPGISVATGLQF